MFAGFECRLNLVKMEIGRGADIENVDIGPATDLVKTLGYFLDAVFSSNLSRALQIEVANYFDLEKVRELPKAFDV
jgi:hypothetical protein